MAYQWTPRALTALALQTMKECVPDDELTVPLNVAQQLNIAEVNILAHGTHGLQSSPVVIICAGELIAYAIMTLHKTGEIPMRVDEMAS